MIFELGQAEVHCSFTLSHCLFMSVIFPHWLVAGDINIKSKKANKESEGIVSKIKVGHCVLTVKCVSWSECKGVNEELGDGQVWGHKNSP